jgi:hypothetical protein
MEGTLSRDRPVAEQTLSLWRVDVETTTLIGKFKRLSRVVFRRIRRRPCGASGDGNYLGVNLAARSCAKLRHRWVHVRKTTSENGPQAIVPSVACSLLLLQPFSSLGKLE